MRRQTTIRNSKFLAGSLLLGLIFLVGLFTGCDWFEETTYILDANVNKEEAGSVHKDPELDEYIEGETVTLTAVPNDGWEFSHWEGDEGGTEPVLEIEMDGDKEIKAIFERLEYSLTITTEGEGEVDIIEIIEPQADKYPYETIVKLIADPNDAWEFSHWEGDASGDEESIEIEMDEGKEVIAVFEFKGDGAIVSFDLKEGSWSSTFPSFDEDDAVFVILFPRDDLGFKHRVGRLSAQEKIVSSVENIESLDGMEKPSVKLDTPYDVHCGTVSEFIQGIEKKIRRNHDLYSTKPGRKLPLKSPVEGEERDFWVLDPEFEEKTAELRGLNDNALLWVTEDADVSDAAVDFYLNEFERYYSDLKDYFGREPTAENFEVLQDVDGRVNIVLSPMPYGGYFYSIDLYSQEVAEEFDLYSNEDKVIYVNSDMDEGHTAGVIAHEFQHLLFYNESVLAERPTEIEDIWINEGFSELAQDIAGFGYKQDNPYQDYRIQEYIKIPWKVSVISWEQQIEDYAASYLFARYIYDQYGKSMLEAISTSSQSPQAAIEGFAGTPSEFHRVFENWSIALLTHGFDEVDLGEEFAFSDDISLPVPFGSILEPDQAWKDWFITGWGVSYTAVYQGSGEDIEIQIEEAAEAGEFWGTVIIYSFDD